MGNYPQREDSREGWFDRTADKIGGFIRQYIYSGSLDDQQFIDAVNQAAEGLDALDDKGLRAQVIDLRKRLYSEGLQDKLVAESFALIREVSSRTLSMRHHNVQLYGGWAMLRGKIAEMETGEGKTLTATLPACTAALAGIPVHVVTVNDFLVARDSKWMSAIYEALGLTVGTVLEDSSTEQRQAAYACDITYCTNKQLVFDYLKDRMLLEQESRPLHLQLEGLYQGRPKTSRLLMRGLCFAIVDEADSVLIDEARTPLIISNTTKMEQEETLFQQAIHIAKQLRHKQDFNLSTSTSRIQLTDYGKAQLLTLTRGLGGVWSGTRRRDELIKQALSALHYYQKDQHYLVKDGKVQIIDESTGRVMPDRSWERGLHQMIEVKEGCAISGRQETLARISYQRFFRRYLHLAGMTGTAAEVTQELTSVYQLSVEKIPTHNPVQRKACPDFVYATERQKWRKIIDIIKDIHDEGRPLLIGAKSVQSSEHLSGLLNAENLQHQILNARQDHLESQIVSQAGRVGAITVATNMAGRGTDIELFPGVTERGGLHVLATERHDARRIDRQLFGRGARQGDPGSYQTIVSLEDDFIDNVFGDRLAKFFARRTEPLPQWLGNLIVSYAQRSAEKHHRRIRQDLLKYDDNLSDLLSFSGRGE
ncbi:prepilin peptidase [Oceanicoccus sagamiensis]|uniref:Protein translocase subunit SecA n=2 Tax=Oceanicoccus sagamiensis TaxID=716816 RepID=A0A1X9NHI5_9GAMM|nr:prepilin peptidase [Oceanicoccus sagamiensis]